MMAGATYPSVFSALTAIAREEGWQALYRCAPLLDSHSSPLCRRIHRAPMLRSVPGGPSTPGVLHWSCGTVARPATPFSQLVKALASVFDCRPASLHSHAMGLHLEQCGPGDVAGRVHGALVSGGGGRCDPVGARGCRGLGVSCIKQAPQTGLTLFAYDACKKVLDLDR